MNKKTYQEIIKCHLTKYKKINFPLMANGFWKINNKSYPHILPEENKYDNLLPIYKKKLIDYLDNNNIKLHSDFHHLNSSQAMCFNFFYPLILEKKLELVTDFLELKDKTIKYETVCFEKDGKDKMKGRRPTNFDFYFETISGKKMYFEIKYTETEFGKAKNDKEHNDKFDNIYSKLLNPLKEEFHLKEVFFNNYQILRNLIHIDENSYVVFIYPQDNLKIKEKAEKVKDEILNKKFHDNFKSVTWEDLFSFVQNKIIDIKPKQLVLQMKEFKEKYKISLSTD